MPYDKDDPYGGHRRSMVSHGKAVPAGETITIKGVSWLSEGGGKFKKVSSKKARRKAPRTMIRRGKAVPVGHIIKIGDDRWISKGKGRFEEIP